MPGSDGEIWVDGDGKFIVTENNETIILIPDVPTEPINTWTEETGLDYESWDTEE